MCDICHKTPCDYRCPNAPDPATIYECAFCGEPIVAGDIYYHHDSKYYHEDCFPDAAPQLVAERDGLTAGAVTDTEDELAICPLCKEPVLSYEERWVNGPTMYHHECLMDNASSMLGAHALIAEEQY